MIVWSKRNSLRSIPSDSLSEKQVIKKDNKIIEKEKSLQREEHHTWTNNQVACENGGQEAMKSRPTKKSKEKLTENYDQELRQKVMVKVCDF